MSCAPSHISRLEVKPILSSNNIMNSQRSGRILPNKKDTVSGVSFYSAIQLPAAISMWESSGFHSSVGCGSRRQYFVFAPHQAFAFSFCILLLFYLHRHLAWELPRLPNKKCTSKEMHFLFSNVLSFQAVPGKYFRPHLVNRVDFAPSMTSARITPAPAVACLQADTAVIRLQPYLRQTSLNFPKWECLALLPTSHG